VNLMVAMLVALLVFHGAGLYKPRRDKSFLLEIAQILKAGVAIWVLLIALIYYTAAVPFTRLMLALFLPLLIAGLILERGIFRATLRSLRRRGWNLRHALIVGTGRLGQMTLLRLQRNSWMGIRVAGFVDAAPAPARTIRGIPVVGHTDSLRDIVENTGVDCVFIALRGGKSRDTRDDGQHLRRILAQLDSTAADVRVIPDIFLARFPLSATITDFDGLPVISLREDPLAGWPAIYKRLFDLTGALFAIAIFALPMLIIAIAIKLEGGGPVLYRQRRMSYGRRAFWMLKFRTMRSDAEAGGPAFAAAGDPRCTPFGRRLRAWSLDELPQLFNVLRGEMSLVGPRPERPEMLARIQEEVPGFPLRLKAQAGLTGWAQIKGFRGRSSFRKRLQYDLYYLNHWSPFLDVRILLATLLRPRHPNAY